MKIMTFDEAKEGFSTLLWLKKYDEALAWYEKCSYLFDKPEQIKVLDNFKSMIYSRPFVKSKSC